MVTGGEGASKQYISMNAVHKINPYWVGHICLLMPGTPEQISRTFGVWFYTTICVQTLLLDCTTRFYRAASERAGGCTSFARRMWSRAPWLGRWPINVSWVKSLLIQKTSSRFASLTCLCFRALGYLHVNSQHRLSYCCLAVYVHLPSDNFSIKTFQKTFPMRMAVPKGNQIPWQVSQGKKNTALLTLWSLFPQNSPYYVNACKSKAVPLHARSDPEGCRKLRLPDFMTTTQGGGKVVSLTHRPPLPPGNTPGTHFC